MGGVVQTIIPHAPIGDVTTWGDAAYVFAELTRQTFDPAQRETDAVAVVVHPGLGLRSYTTRDGEVFRRDSGTPVTRGRYEEELDKLMWGGVRVLVEKGAGL